MDTQIVLVYVVCDDMLKAFNHREDPQAQLSDAEIMTIAIVAALFFGANFGRSLTFLTEQGYLRGTLSKSRFSRRLHRIKGYFLTLFQLLARRWKALNTEQIYIVDTLPVPICGNIHIRRCRIYRDEAYRGYQSSKRRYFYGLKVHLMVTETGQPVELFLSCGAFSNTSGLELFSFDMPANSLIIGGKAYNYYLIEDLLKEAGMELRPIRKHNSTRRLPPWMEYLQNRYRKMIETDGSMIERLLPKSIHVTNAAGFELKMILFTLASSINCLQRV